MASNIHRSNSRKGISRVCAQAGLLLILLAGFGLRALAQTAEPASRPDRGIGAVGSYALSDIENINMTNGNVNISVPLAGLPPVAGGKLSWVLRAIYNSKLWDLASIEQLPDQFHHSKYATQHLDVSFDGGWKIGGRYILIDQLADADVTVNCNGDPICLQSLAYRHKMILLTPDGARHELRPLDATPYTGSELWRRGYYAATPDNTGTTMRYYSYDGSYLWATISPSDSAVQWTVYMQDGTQIVQRKNGIQKIKDNVGNFIQIYSETDAAGIVTTHFQDAQTNREIRYVYNPSGSATGQVQYQTVGGVWVNIDINFGTTTLQGLVANVNDRVCTDWGENLGETLTVIRSIVLPQTEPGPRRQYTFNYSSDTTDAVNPPVQYKTFCGQPLQSIFTASHGWGALSRMILPSGATVEYDYELDGRPNRASFLNQAREVPRDRIKQKRLIHDGTTDTWDYNINNIGSSVTGPDGSVTQDFFDHDPSHAAYMGGSTGLSGQVYRTTQSNKVIVERHWTQKIFSGAHTDSPDGAVGFNLVVDAEYTTLLNSSGNPSKMSAKTYQYDFNGNQTQQIEYDWFSPASVSRDPLTGVPTGVPAGATVLRTTTNSFYNPATTSTSSNVYAKRAIATATPLILNAPKETIVGASQARYSYDSQAYGTAPSIGLLTKMSVWDDRANKFIDTLHTYDVTYGNLISTTDPKGNVTQYFYDDAAHAQPNRVVVDPLNGTGQQTTTTVYDFSTGLVTSQTDPNGNQTTTDYTNQLLVTVDPLGRPGVVTGPPVASTVVDSTGSIAVYANQRHKTVIIYRDAARQVETRSDLNTENDGLLRSQTSQDQLGRVILTETSENGSTYTISSNSVYQQMGRITFTSNPRRAGAASTDGWTRVTSDDLGRVVEVATFSGAAQPPSSGTNSSWTGSVVTDYNAEVTTVADQAGRKRHSTSDGSGRLTQVEELNLNGTVYATTSYTYDRLNNLTQVTQGSQQRQFIYDSLSRLREAYTPEQVNISGQKVSTIYQYDDASNLTSRTNPNGTQVSFTYDGLNRVRTKTLSIGGDFTYNYDTGVNGKGRIVSIVKQGSTDGYYYDGYDAAGRLTASRQRTDFATNNAEYTISYGYDLAGNLSKEVYPSGRTILTSYDSAGRISRLGGQKAGESNRTYCSSYTYTAHSAPTSLLLGNSLFEHTNYNSRLQPTQIGLGTVANPTSLFGLDFTYGTTDNNGNVQTQAISAPKTAGGVATFSLNYSYDHLNRLLSAAESGSWSQTFTYDQYGNRTSLVNTGGLPLPVTPTPNPATNRLSGYGYDTSGNVINDGQGNTFTYDAENHQTSHINSSGTSNYIYDGEERRVKRVTGGVTSIYVYDAEGRLIAEYNSPDQPIQGGGGTSYLTTDHLGSTRLVTSATGAVKTRRDYLAFGEEIASTLGQRGQVTGYGANEGLRQQFTSKERDGESGLDYFLARYYSSTKGRFTSVDPLLSSGNGYDPQTWNRYIYTLNCPLRYTDPFGLALRCTLDGRTTSCARIYDLIASGQFESVSYTINGVGYTVRKADFYETLPAPAGQDPDVYYLGTRFNEKAFNTAIAPILQRLRKAINSELADGFTGFGGVGDFSGGGASDSWGGPENRKAINATSQQIQKKFKHASDFGVDGNFNKQNAAKFEQAIQDHVNDPGSKAIDGTYHGQPATIYVNSSSRLAVITDKAGNFISGWKLSEQQLQHVLTTGKLGGGN